MIKHNISGSVFFEFVKSHFKIEDIKMSLIKDQYFKLKKNTIRLLFYLTVSVYAVIVNGYFKAGYYPLMWATLFTLVVVVVFYIRNYNKPLTDQMVAFLFIYIPISNVLMKDVFFLLQKNPLIDTIFLHTQFILVLFMTFGGLITNHRHILYTGILSVLWIWTFTILANDPFLWSLVILNSVLFMGISCILFFVYSGVEVLILEFDKAGCTITTQNAELNQLLEFKNTMMDMMIHDIKNPINTILTACKSSTARTAEITEQGNNILLIVENILDIHKMEDFKMTLKLSTQTLDGVLKKAVKRVKCLLDEKKITLTTRISVKSLVDVDENLLERVFINLLTNAIKYSEVNSLIEVRLIPAEGCLRAEIVDTGLGIAGKDQDHIFDKYYQVKAKNSGTIRSTGLGLTFCKLVVETHGGSIGVESVLNRGTTFWFELPVCTVPVLLTEEVSCISPNKFEQSELEENQFIQYKLKIAKLSIYQTSEILNVFKIAPVGVSLHFQAWKEEIINCSITGNTEYFNQLRKIEC